MLRPLADWGARNLEDGLSRSMRLRNARGSALVVPTPRAPDRRGDRRSALRLSAPGVAKARFRLPRHRVRSPDLASQQYGTGARHGAALIVFLPIQETLEAIEELEGLQLLIGSVIVNRNIPAYPSADDLAKAAEGDIDADTVRTKLQSVGITLSDSDFAGLLTETIQHATRIGARAESASNSTSSTWHGWSCRRFPTGRPRQPLRTGRGACPPNVDGTRIGTS